MNNPLTVPARDGIEAQRGLNDIFPGDPYPVRDQLKRGLDVLRAKASRGKITSADVFSMTDPLMDILARIEATALERGVRERDEARAWCERHHADLVSAEAKLAEARKVIEPFADCNMFNDTCPDNTPAWWTGAELDETSDVTVGDFRAARRFLEETK